MTPQRDVRDAHEALWTDQRALKPLLVRLADVKRLRSADLPRSSLAQRGFERAWADLCAGDDAEAVALRETAAAVAATELGAIDAVALRRCGLDAGTTEAVLREAIDKAAATLAAPLRQRLRATAMSLATAFDATPRRAPDFVRCLHDQPRAGASHPTAGRLILEPAESHADHSIAVALGAVLWAGQRDGDVVEPFLAGLAHHLHNAALPDGGFAAEELLAARLPPLVERLREDALGELPTALAERVRSACRLTTHADSAPAQAFQAADVIDRVVEAEHFERVARFRLTEALGALGLVHPGPLKTFQDRVLTDFGWPS